MKYMIYTAAAVLILWAVVYLIRHIRRQLKGDGASCGGECGACPGCGSCHHKK